MGSSFRRIAFVAAVLFATAAAACGTTARTATRTDRDALRVPPRITEATYGELRRSFFSTPVDAEGRDRLRRALFAYLAQQHAATFDTTAEVPEERQNEAYDRAVAAFAEMTELLAPEDFVPERMPRELAAGARFIATRGERRGDEGRVLAALYVLALIGGEDGARARAEYQRLDQWGRNARRALPGLTRPFDSAISVWREHARLTPGLDVLRNLEALFVGRRDRLIQVFGPDGTGRPPPGSMTFEEYQMATRAMALAAYDVASVYLAVGDLTTALARVEALGVGLGADFRLTQALRAARDGGDTGEEALLAIAQAFGRDRPEVARGVCRRARVDHPERAAFAQCLGRLAALGDDLATAMAEYEAAIRIAPDDRELMDEAIRIAAAAIDPGRDGENPTLARRAYRRATTLIEQRRERFPRSAPPVEPAAIELAMGVAEMNAGFVEPARERLEASLRIRRTAMGLLQLGMLSERTGDAARARALYREALDSTPEASREEANARAELLEHLADASRRAGDPQFARRMYTQALELWSAAARNARGEALAAALVRRGVLLDRLGDHPQAAEAFRQATLADPGRRFTYAGILSHLVAQPEADVALAVETFRRATTQMTLEPEWKVYLALWTLAIQRRAGVTDDPEALTTLREHVQGDAWSARLARFGTGDSTGAQLLGAASTRGHRCEALFYDALFRYAAGERGPAREGFVQALGIGMVNFFEHGMALELVELIPGADQGQPAAATTVPTH
ncbi:MAG: tetratricopeptide repeat protein [Deltaproteobacteria bacterium]|nr:tetratricopeptide repeat protein [Deltaproteobacteria bacterium]